MRKGAPKDVTEVRIGTSGWRYPPWRTTFYPEGLPQRRELEYASRRVRTIEINGSFYSLQRPTSFETWFAETPDDFVFALKGGRFITHAKKLRDCETALANFFASGILALRHKLGPILWQLPPQLAFDEARLASFFSSLPRTTRAIAKLGAKHDARLKHGSFLEVDRDRPVRYALEVRHPSYVEHAARLVALLREHDIGLCVSDMAGKYPMLQELTSSLVYVRLHGDKVLYVSGYGKRSLDRWAENIARWRDGGQDVFVYFDNDVQVRAPFDAINLAARLDQGEPAKFPRRAFRKADRAGRIEEPRTVWRGWGQTGAPGATR